MVTLSPEAYPHARLRAIYEAARAAYTAPLLIKTNKPRKKKVRPAEVEQLKHRIESVEGNDPIEIAFKPILTGATEPESNFAMDTAAIPPQGFQGA